jgi:sugar/nucleoside kinase (ribokinase family)
MASSALTEHKPKILCTGIAVQDIVMRVERFPAPGEKVHGSEFMTIGGGCAANAAVSIARLGGDVVFAGPLGGDDDAVSSRIVAELEAEGIACSGIVRAPGATASVSLVLIDGTGEKSIATRRGKRLSEAPPGNTKGLVADVDAVLADNRFPDFAAELCRAGRTRNLPVVVDLDQASEPRHPLIALGTHVIASREALRGMTGENDPGAGLRALSGYATGLVAVSDGPNGVYWLEESTPRHIPAFRVEVVDSLGAGDVFHGAFTLALVEGRKIADALRFASAVAAIKCTRFGGGAAAPRRAEVNEFLRQQRL